MVQMTLFGEASAPAPEAAPQAPAAKAPPAKKRKAPAPKAPPAKKRKRAKGASGGAEAEGPSQARAEEVPPTQPEVPLAQPSPASQGFVHSSLSAPTLRFGGYQPIGDALADYCFEASDQEEGDTSAKSGAAEAAEAAGAAEAAEPSVGAAASGGEVGVVHMGRSLPLEDDPFCSKCGFKVDPWKKGTKLISKTKAAWCCGQCNSKAVMLSNMFGAWPLPEFKELSAQVQQQFWQESSSDKEGLKKAVEKHLVHSLIEARTATEAGPFLPLSVWQKKGFDTDQIQAKAKKEWHAVLGWTYQVKVHSTGRESKEELVRHELYQLLSRKKGGGVGKGAGGGVAGEAIVSSAPEVEEPKEAESPSSSGSESSSSSSSSSDGKKKSSKKKASKKKKAAKKDKKIKKEKKDKAAAKEAAERLKTEKAQLKAEKAPVVGMRCHVSLRLRSPAGQA